MTIETTVPPVRTLAPAARAVEVLGGDLTEASLRRYLNGIPGVDAVGLEQRAAGLGTRPIKTSSKRWALDTIIRLIDLTTLEGADTPGKVRSLVAKALTPDAGDPTTPRPAAVCVYGDMVPYAVEALGASHAEAPAGVAVAAVATAFPSGRASLAVTNQRSPSRSAMPSPRAPTRSTWSSTAVRSSRGATAWSSTRSSPSRRPAAGPTAVTRTSRSSSRPAS